VKVVDKGRQLLKMIHCSSLEQRFTEFADKWVEENVAIADEMKR